MVGAHDAGDHLDDGRLASTVGSEQGEDLARADRERHTLNRVDTA
jgi:hypothetical protein